MYQEPIVQALDSATTSQGALTPPTASGTGPGPKHLLCSLDALVRTRLVHTRLVHVRRCCLPCVVYLVYLMTIVATIKVLCQH